MIRKANGEFAILTVNGDTSTSRVRGNNDVVSVSGFYSDPDRGAYIGYVAPRPGMGSGNGLKNIIVGANKEVFDPDCGVGPKPEDDPNGNFTWERFPGTYPGEVNNLNQVVGSCQVTDVKFDADGNFIDFSSVSVGFIARPGKE